MRKATFAIRRFGIQGLGKFYDKKVRVGRGGFLKEKVRKREQLTAEKQRLRDEARFEKVLRLAATLNDEKAIAASQRGLLLKGQELFEFRVGSRTDLFGPHRF